MTGYQWLGALVLVGLLSSFIVTQGRDLGYGFTLSLLLGIVVVAAVVNFALALLTGALP